MEPKLANFGSSLPVPCVQELAKEPLTAVPPRYVRPDQDPPFISNTTSSPQVPVVDLIRLLSGDSMESELEKFHYACQKWGFFQLINHGVSTSLVEKVKVEIQEFFKQPMEEKKKYCQQVGGIEGYGQTFMMSEEQKLDWADMFHFITLLTPHSFKETPRIAQPPSPTKIVTNGIYKSIEHRATVNSSKERLSIATFYNLKLEGDMGPAPSLITPETPALFRRIGVTDYFKGFFSGELRGRSYVDVMRIQNGSDKSNGVL